MPSHDAYNNSEKAEKKQSEAAADRDFHLQEFQWQMVITKHFLELYQVHIPSIRLQEKIRKKTPLQHIPQLQVRIQKQRIQCHTKHFL